MPKKSRKSHADDVDERSSKTATPRSSGQTTPRSRASRRGSIDDEDAGMDQGQMMNIISELEDPVVAAVKEAVDNMSAKRTSVRESSLLTLSRALCMRAPNILEDTLESRTETITTYLKRMIKRDAGAKECSLSCRICALLALALGWSDNHDYYSEFSRQMIDVIQHHSIPEARSDAALSMSILVYLINESDMPRVIDMFITVFDNKASPAQLLETCVRCVSWLICELSTAVTSGLVERIIKSHLSLIVHPELNVRLAAGESLATLASAVSQDSHLTNTFNEFLAQILDLVSSQTQIGISESSKKTQKRDRASQKAGFRSVKSSLENFPVDPDYGFDCFDLVFGKVRYKVDTWRKNATLIALRQLYMEGLQVQVMNANACVCHLLDIDMTLFDYHDRIDRRAFRYEKEYAKRSNQMEIGKSRADKFSVRDSY